jgi:hypothetical protein
VPIPAIRGQIVLPYGLIGSATTDYTDATDADGSIRAIRGD